jgi:uncharacterized MAPEG superfamily protein
VTNDLFMLVYSAVLAWMMLLTASLLRTRAHRLPGLKIAFGNRDDVPEPTPLVGRADRAARNMVENLVLFTAILAAARLGGVHGSRVDLGAKIFFWSRVAYFPVYLAGIAYVRTAIWCVSLVGLAMIVASAFSS